MNIPENFDRWMFDYMEGNLSLKEVETFEQFLLQNPDLEPEIDAWNSAVIPGDDVVYPNQKNLERRRIVGWYGWSAAAMLVLLIGTGGYIAMNNGASDDVSSEASYATESNLSVSSQSLYANNNQLGESVALEQDSDLNDSEQGSLATNLLSQNSATHLRTVNNSTSNEGAQMYYTGDQSASNHENSNGDASNGGSNKYVSVNATMQQAQNKYASNKHGSHYVQNPTERNKDLDLSKKNNINLNSFSSATKRIYRKVEKMLGYPVGLVNLRDPDLTLPDNSLTSFNPGFVGGMLMPRFEMNYRNQWLSSSMNTHKAQFSFDNYIHEVRGGFGVMLNSATYANGAFGDYSIDAVYSPKISLSKNVVFEPALKVTLGAITGNSSKLLEDQNIELDRGLLLTNNLVSGVDRTDVLWYKDYGVGFVLNTKWFYAGFSADNLGGHYANVYTNEGEIKPTRTPVLFNGIVGADYESANKKMTISPFVSMRQFGASTEAWAGMNYRLDHFTLGGAYSTKQDYTLSIGMKFNKFKLVYQYDRTRTLLSDEQIGSHNIGIRFNGEIKNARFKQ